MFNKPTLRLKTLPYPSYRKNFKFFWKFSISKRKFSEKVLIHQKFQLCPKFGIFFPRKVFVGHFLEKQDRLYFSLSK